MGILEMDESTVIASKPAFPLVDCIWIAWSVLVSIFEKILYITGKWLIDLNFWKWLLFHSLNKKYDGTIQFLNYFCLMHFGNGNCHVSNIPYVKSQAGKRQVRKDLEASQLEQHMH